MLSKLAAIFNRAFRWLADLVGGGRVPYEPVAIPFPPVDVPRFIRELDLGAEGASRGARNLPAQDNFLLDDVEQRIVTAIESERDKACGVFAEHLGVYEKRLGAMQIRGPLQRAAVAADAARAAFEEKVGRGKGRLFQHQRNLAARARELDRFKGEHGLDRPSNRPKSRLLHWGFVAILWLAEAFLNGMFLARGLEFGLIEGVGVASAIAAINVGAGLFAGLLLLRQKNHRKSLRKLAGILGFTLYAGVALALNLGVAHYRDALGGPDPDNAAALALASFLAAPFQIADLLSFYLFLLGMIFSFGAAADGYRMDDPYPGYGSLLARHEAELEYYREEKETQANELTAVKDEMLRQLDNWTTEIEAMRGQHQAVLRQRDDFEQSFHRHLNHLEQAGNELLTYYRNANVPARTAPAPQRFLQSWKLGRP
jgi:hypothetical protein